MKNFVIVVLVAVLSFVGGVGSTLYCPYVKEVLGVKCPYLSGKCSGCCCCCCGEGCQCGDNCQCCDCCPGKCKDCCKDKCKVKAKAKDKK